MAQNDRSSIYIMPFKIQKQRLRDIQNSISKKKLTISPTINKASYVVTEYDSLEQVREQLKKDGITFPESACIVKMKWLVECLKSSSIVQVEDNHKVKQIVKCCVEKPSSKPVVFAEWACQRGARITYPNKIFSDALEILQEHAELRDGNQDYSRALAFRRASCVLKSLPALVTDIHQLDRMKDIGGHASSVIADIMDQGYSTEAEGIKSSDSFKKMKLFTGVFGIGPSTAKKWIEKGWSTIEEVVTAANFGADWRVSWGLAFYQDLNSPVSLCEATSFVNIVKELAEHILPGVIISLVGGFRREKACGHDVDILFTHPEEGKELGFLAKLLTALEKHQLLLVGHSEKNSFKSDILHQDFKLSMRGQLDHFEKWLGICKFPNSFQKTSLCQASDYPRSNKNTSSNRPQKEKIPPSHLDCLDRSKCDEQSGHHPDKSLDESLDNDSFEPLLKKTRLEGNSLNQPEELANSSRDWTARRVDLIVSPYSQFFYALVGWTGSKHFNRDARLYAQKIHGLKLTSHGLYDFKKQESIPATSEEEVFSHLGIPYRQPCERNC